MGIHALPLSAVRALGASQLLNDPAAVVKELVENALDANATSIAIEIHHNSLDIIQVRDNGHGIAPNDRPLVARRYCTSKMCPDEDLRDIGGSTLGFRGEAIASTAEMSGSLTISTRVEGERMAAMLSIGRQGEIVAQKPASFPVGTTVKITDFITDNPVRKRIALKRAEQSLKEVKRILQSYSFARPHVRFSLRVLKAKGTKGDWLYAPKPNGGIEDAAFKIVGATCVSQCTWSVLEDHGFIFQAFLPCRDADASKICSIGAFLSVDDRPVSMSRGVLKDIVKAFCDILKRLHSTSHIQKPFIYINIICPKGSYDVSWEPAKNDVIFEDPKMVVEGVKRLFSRIYARSAEVSDDEASFSQEELPSERPKGRSEHTTSHGNCTPEESIVPDFQGDHTNTASVLADDVQTISPQPSAFRSDMFEYDGEDLESSNVRSVEGRTENDTEDYRRVRGDISISNPWVLAKMNRSRRHPSAGSNEATTYQDGTNTHEKGFTSKREIKVPKTGAAMLPTPWPSSPSLRRSDGISQLECAHNTFVKTDGRLIGRSDPFSLQNHGPVECGILKKSDDGFNGGQKRPDIGLRDEFLSSCEPGQSSGTPLHAIPESTTRQLRKPRECAKQFSPASSPFARPLREQDSERENVWFDQDRSVAKPRPRRERGPRNQKQNSNGLIVQGESSNSEHVPNLRSPVRHNRDIREFVGCKSADSVASMIEYRNYGPFTESNMSNLPVSDRVDLDQATPERSGVLPGWDSIPASEVLAQQSQFSASEKHAVRQPKRRKTNERRLLQELSSNTLASSVAPNKKNKDGRPQFRRRSSGGHGLTKSSTLLVDRVSAGENVKTLLVVLNIPLVLFSRLAASIDKGTSLSGYGKPASGPHFIFLTRQLGLQELATNLHNLLTAADVDVIENTSRQTLFQALETAFDRFAQMINKGDSDMPSLD